MPCPASCAGWSRVRRSSRILVCIVGVFGELRTHADVGGEELVDAEEGRVDIKARDTLNCIGEVAAVRERIERVGDQLGVVVVPEANANPRCNYIFKPWLRVTAPVVRICLEMFAKAVDIICPDLLSGKSMSWLASAWPATVFPCGPHKRS